MSIRRGVNIEYTTPLPYVLQALDSGCRHIRWHITGDTTHGQAAYRESLMFLALELKLKMASIHPRADVAVALMDAPPDIDELPTIWRELAELFQGVSGIFGFDILNEPKLSLEQWRRISSRTIRAIKSITPRRRCIVQTRRGEPGRLRELEPVPADMLSVHYYLPMAYTHQGLYTYPAPASYVPSTLSRSLAALERSAKADGRPLYVGEFSVVVDAPRARKWLGTVAECIRKNRWHSAYHAWCPAPCPWEAEAEDRLDLLKGYWSGK